MIKLRILSINSGIIKIVKNPKYINKKVLIVGFTLLFIRLKLDLSIVIIKY